MKFYLLKDQPVPFIFTSFSAEDLPKYYLEADLFKRNRPENERQAPDSSFNWKLLPFTENEPEETQKCERLLKLITEFLASKNSPGSIWYIFIEINVDDVLSCDVIRRVEGKLMLGANNWSVLDGMHALSDGDARVQVSIEEHSEEDPSAAPLPKIVSEEMSISDDDDDAKRCYSSFLVPMRFLKEAKENDAGISLKVSVFATMPDEALTGIYKSQQKRTSAKNISSGQKILEAQILTDVTLVAGNGTKILAHKTFLASSSSVFLAMFQTDMKEARESVVELEDMSEESVKALLKYLYYQDIEDAVGSNGIAFELFCAAHKYNIGMLEEAMRKLLLEKEYTWFLPSLAVNMFVYARNLTPPDELLKIRAVQVLRGHTMNLMDIPECKELFEKDVTAAMELCQISLHTSLK